MIVPPSSTYPAQVYWSWMMTLWRINERHDCHARPKAANDRLFGIGGMEAAESPAGFNGPQPGSARRDALFCDHLPASHNDVTGHNSKADRVSVARLFHDQLNTPEGVR